MTRRASPRAGLALLSALGLALAPAWTACRARVAPARGGGPVHPEGQVWLTPAQAAAMRLAVASVDAQDVDDAVVTAGRVAFDDARVTHVYPPVAGRIVRIDAQLGQRVRRGDPLAVILSPDVGEASAELTRAESDVATTQRDWQRQRDLVAQGAASPRDAEAALNAFRRATADLERARERMRLYHAGSYDRVTQRYTVRAEIDGEVIARSASPGANVQGQISGGSPQELFTLGDLARVWVLADVYEVDLARVAPGARATVSVVAYPGRVFEGTVDWVAGALDPATRTARVRIALPNPDRALRPEMYATAVVYAPPVRALAVPRTAVLRQGGRAVVFVERGGAPGGATRYERTPVEVDETRAGRWVPVLRGISAGERVVTSGGIQLVGMLGGGEAS